MTPGSRRLLKFPYAFDRSILNLTVEFTLFIFYKNVVFPAQVEYSYFSADFRLKIFLYYS